MSHYKDTRLARTKKIRICMLNMQTGEGPRKRAMTGVESDIRVDRGSSDSGKSERSDAISQGDTTSQKSDPSPLYLNIIYLELVCNISLPKHFKYFLEKTVKLFATPQLASKRKSLHGRKLRPQSVVVYNYHRISQNKLPTLNLEILPSKRFICKV
ncbi:hypothetical protein Avbf_13039 [Armadillidium vulgare]|nr:hypothetical protein Avbf_13039 [Armadillidium vulgare]